MSNAADAPVIDLTDPYVRISFISLRDAVLVESSGLDSQGRIEISVTAAELADRVLLGAVEVFGRNAVLPASRAMRRKIIKAVKDHYTGPGPNQGRLFYAPAEAGWAIVTILRRHIATSN